MKVKHLDMLLIFTWLILIYSMLFYPSTYMEAYQSDGNYKYVIVTPSYTHKCKSLDITSVPRTIICKYGERYAVKIVGTYELYTKESYLHLRNGLF